MFRGGPGRTRPSFIRLVHEADCRMDTPDEADVRRSLFMLPMFRVCVFSDRFSGGARSGLLLWVPSRFAATAAPQRQRQPSHRARRVLRRMGGGKNDRHKRRGCLTRCRRPFFIRTAIRELFRIRNFGGSKKLVRQPPPYSYCSGSLPERAVHERSKKSSDKALSVLDRMRSAGRRNVFPAERPPRSAVRRTPPVSGARSRTNRSGTRRRRVAPHRCRP